MNIFYKIYLSSLKNIFCYTIIITKHILNTEYKIYLFFYFLNFEFICNHLMYMHYNKT